MKQKETTIPNMAKSDKIDHPKILIECMSPAKNLEGQGIHQTVPRNVVVRRPGRAAANLRMQV